MFCCFRSKQIEASILTFTRPFARALHWQSAVVRDSAQELRMVKHSKGRVQKNFFHIAGGLSLGTHHYSYSLDLLSFRSRLGAGPIVILDCRMFQLCRSGSVHVYGLEGLHVCRRLLVFGLLQKTGFPRLKQRHCRVCVSTDRIEFARAFLVPEPGSSSTIHTIFELSSTYDTDFDCPSPRCCRCHWHWHRQEFGEARRRRKRMGFPSRF